MALGKVASSWRSWISHGTTLVKVQAFTASTGVRADEKRGKFPVMVRVTAEDPAVGSKPGRRQHVGVDIVAVLDISGSMLGEKLDRMKDAMTNVIDKLGPQDRLSIVTFESSVNCLTELTYMSDRGRIAARDKIRDLCSNGGTKMEPALSAGAQILRRRPAEEQSCRIGCILFLSDGLDPSIFGAKISPEFPAHTFGLGDDHDAVAMKYIADKTSGTYSFVNKDPSKIKDAFAVFIAGITSVVATAAEITLGTHEDVTIAEIASGGYPSEVSAADKRSGTIRIDNMYAGDKKNFVVYLELPIRTEVGKQKVLTVGGQYRSLGASTKQIAGTDVSVLRPRGDAKSTVKLGTNDEVATEVARTKLVEEIDELVNQTTVDNKVEVVVISTPTPSPPPVTPNNNQQINGDSLGQALKNAKVSVKELMEDENSDWWTALENEVEKMKSPGRPFYILSWLSCHKLQRATTKDELSDTSDFLTPGQKEIVKDAAAAASSSPPPPPTTTKDATWKEVITARVRSIPCSCLLPSVVAATLAVAMVYSTLEAGRSSNDRAMVSLGPLQYPMLSESESNYPAWAIKMEAYMRAQGVWDAVTAKDPHKVPTRKDQMALAAIYQAIPEGTLFLLAQKKTARSAWEALRSMHVGDQRLRDAKLQTLRLRFEGMRMKETDSVDDFAARLTTTVNEIQALGEHIQEAYVVKKLLRAVPGKFLQIASAIEQFADLDAMTLQEVIGRLKVHEERLGRLGAAEQENELMTRAEWKAREEAEAAESYDASSSKVPVCASTSLANKILSGHHTYRVSASAAKILDILVTSVLRKEKDVKAIVVEAQSQCDDEVTLRF